ncbi:MAG TPA: ATP-binding protein, partial [Aquabacterium sp.]|nr:ATP-binding protein [Aquabacterium sp.]
GRIEQKGLTFKTSLGQDVPPWIMGDSLRLAQVLNNLVGNAVKFTDVGGITVAIEQISDATPDQSGVLKFSVTDTGIGIDPSCQDRLFDAFTQADSSITRQYGGSGLGLTISKTLVTMMGGYIGLNSDPGVGSEFWFTLPVSIALRPQQVTEPLRRDSLTHASAKSPSSFQGRVLLAEDNRLNQIVAVEFLERMGLEVDVVDNVLEALNRLRQVGPEHFGAVLMDLHMPVMDGLEATRRIRALPSCQALPIIAMTAAALMEDRSACMDAGMVDHISKPVMPEQLYESLKKWMITCKDAEPSSTAPEDPMPSPATPEMPGFDLPGLLTRIMGNETLMWRLLAQFADQEEHAGEQLATLMARGDLDAARHRAHDLKGSAANMGLVAVSQTAAALESALKAGRADAAALSAFQDALQDSLTQIRARLSERAGPTD